MFDIYNKKMFFSPPCFLWCAGDGSSGASRWLAWAVVASCGGGRRQGRRCRRRLRCRGGRRRLRQSRGMQFLFGVRQSALPRHPAVGRWKYEGRLVDAVTVSERNSQCSNSFAVAFELVFLFCANYLLLIWSLLHKYSSTKWTQMKSATHGEANANSRVSKCVSLSCFEMLFIMSLTTSTRLWKESCGDISSSKPSDRTRHAFLFLSLLMLLVIIRHPRRARKNESFFLGSEINLVVEIKKEIFEKFTIQLSIQLRGVVNISKEN